MTIFLAVSTARGADTVFERDISGIEIKGDGWSLKYGSNFGVTALWVPIDGDRSYFSHGRWLRLIDTKKGLVIGRWQFPGEIVRMEYKNHLEVEVKADDPRIPDRRSTFTFDPDSPHLPYWPTGSFMLAYRAQGEPYPEGRGFGFSRRGILENGVVDSQTARRMIPELEETVRRDPLSPWFQVALGRLLRQTGDARASELFDSALRVPTTDFTELLPISCRLAWWGESEASHAFFERGYKDFWERGNDPRLLTNLMSRLIYFGALRLDIPVSLSQRREMIERFYRGSPYNEGSDSAWTTYANYLEKNGSREDAQLWRQRAEDAKHSGALWPSSEEWIFAYCTSLLLAAIGSAILYFSFCYLRYRRQRTLDLSMRSIAPGVARGFSLFNLEYWTRKQRIAFLGIALSCWILLGLASALPQVVTRTSACPLTLGSGSLAGLDCVWYLETKVPSTPERDLILALAYQQNGHSEKAEKFYRSLPQFAEGWNNLGVLLRTSGRAEEARQAFDQALRLDPNLAEAALNLGRAPQTLWTKLHYEYLPDRPMLAPPSVQKFARAFRGGSNIAIYLKSWAGPFAGPLQTSSDFGDNFVGQKAKTISIIVSALLIFAVALVFVIPSRDVTQQPGKAQLVFDMFFPGASPSWSVFGGLALSAWCYFLLLNWLVRWRPDLFIFPTADLTSAYGVPQHIPSYWELHKPGGLWLVAMPALIFGVNLVLVLRRRRAERTSITIG